ncbi:MAG: chemotaxis protein CheX [Lachnospiraceae bacterium]|nr:chemotaxis protein CheX [Lachnospiraceae bacterium]
MKAENVNPFIISICKVMKDMCMLDLKIGKPENKRCSYAADDSIIKLGLVGAFEGYVILRLDHGTALQVVSKMMMMPVNVIDEIGKSAISELGNMIAGNAATIFSGSGTVLDITIPSYSEGASFVPEDDEILSVPFDTGAGKLSLDITIEEKS